MKYIAALIVVEDIARSRRFYEGLLGQAVESDYGENVAFKGGFSIHLKSHFSALLDGRAVGSRANDAELYFEHDDVAGLAARLVAAGVEFLHGPREQPWRQYCARFYDPDGHIVEVGERLQHLAWRLSEEGLGLDEICRVTYLSRPAVLGAIAEYAGGPKGDAKAAAAPGVAIRDARLGDAAAVARLAGQLGYPCESSDVRERLGRVIGSDTRSLLVAEAGGAVVGWIGLEVVERFYFGGFADITGLVVDADHRSRGIGAALIAAAGGWARGRGLPLLSLKTNSAREDAHRFYEREGFERVKEQYQYVKRVVAGE